MFTTIDKDVEKLGTVGMASEEVGQNSQSSKGYMDYEGKSEGK